MKQLFCKCKQVWNTRGRDYWDLSPVTSLQLLNELRDDLEPVKVIKADIKLAFSALFRVTILNWMFSLRWGCIMPSSTTAPASLQAWLKLSGSPLPFLYLWFLLQRHYWRPQTQADHLCAVKASTSQFSHSFSIGLSKVLNYISHFCCLCLFSNILSGLPTNPKNRADAIYLHVFTISSFWKEAYQSGFVFVILWLHVSFTVCHYQSGVPDWSKLNLV